MGVPHFPTLETTVSRLVPFSEERHLTDAYVSWLNDPDIVRYSRQRHRTHTGESNQRYVRAFTKAGNLFWAIEDKTDDFAHIGNITVTIDKIDGVADIGILIGRAQSFGKGHGFAAWIAVMDYLKTRDEVAKISAGCMDGNRAMVRIMEKSGMIFEARRPAHFAFEGGRADALYYGVVKS